MSGEGSDIERAEIASNDGGQLQRESVGERISEILEEEIAAAVSPESVVNGIRGKGYENSDTVEDHSDDGSQDHILHRNGSPVDSMLSIPDDTPSIQVR